MMLLLPIWRLWDQEVSLRVLPPVTQSIAGKATAPIEILSSRSVRSTPVDPKLAVLLGVYFLGLCLLLFRLGLGTIRAFSWMGRSSCSGTMAGRSSRPCSRACTSARRPRPPCWPGRRR